MKVEMVQGLKPIVVEASRVLVRSDDGTPIAVVMEYQPGVYYTCHAGEPDKFRKMLGILGVDKTVVMEEFEVRDMA